MTKWFLFKMIFARQRFQKIMKKLTKETVIEYKENALKEEKYELAAFLEYYLKFKFKEN